MVFSVFWMASNKFIGRKKETVEYAHKHLKLLILVQETRFMLMDIFKVDNNIRHLSLDYCYSHKI
jgi:hypothetical protein